MSDSSHVLLINPLIHDFAAYDFWARPLGLFFLGGLLQRPGLELSLLDCVDPLSPWLPEGTRPRRKAGGQGKLRRQVIPTPDELASVGGRRYARYGLPPERVLAALEAQPRPDLVLVTSMMTYWYPGVAETIALVRQALPGVPVVLGGVYASLCPEHARRHSGADAVVPGPAEKALPLLQHLLGRRLDPPRDPEAFLPAHALAPDADAAALLTSRGCPFKCAYCGVKSLHPGHHLYSLERVEREVDLLTGQLGIRDIALFDDAFLANPERAADLLERLAASQPGGGIRLHAASGLACRGLNGRVARAMRAAGFTTVRLGLETVDGESQRRLGGKVDGEIYEAALTNLEAAGYERGEVGVYAMVGLPGQGFSEVERSVAAVVASGARPRLAYYSPVPGSPMFQEAASISHLDLAEPLNHNPSLMPCAGAEFDGEALKRIRELASSRTG